jgi:transposase
LLEIISSKNFYQGVRMWIKVEFEKNCPNFIKLAKKEKHPVIRVRLIAMAQLKNGKSIGEVAKAIGYERHSVGTWYRRYKEKGLEGLTDLPRPGREPKMSRDQEQEFIKEIENLQDTRSGGRITGNDIRILAKENFGADYAEDTIYTVLKRLKVSWITSRSVHPKADIEAQKTFKKTLKKPFWIVCR